MADVLAKAPGSERLVFVPYGVPGDELEVEITEAKKVAWCGCRESKNKPYCDGTHRTL